MSTVAYKTTHLWRENITMNINYIWASVFGSLIVTSGIPAYAEDVFLAITSNPGGSLFTTSTRSPPTLNSTSIPWTDNAMQIVHKCSNVASSSESWIDCPSEVLERTVSQCTVNGEPIPATISGFTFDVLWYGDNVSVAERPYGAVRSYSNYGVRPQISNSLPAAERVWTGPDVIQVLCTFDFSATGLEMKQGYDGYVRTTEMLLPVSSSVYARLSAPTPMYGIIGEPISSTVTLSTLGLLTHTKLSWTVGEPCSRWAPEMSISGSIGNSVPADGESHITISGVTNSLVFSFNPNSAGNFRCLGTVTLSTP